MDLRLSWCVSAIAGVSNPEYIDDLRPSPTTKGGACLPSC
jgi:hypothetical protein